MLLGPPCSSAVTNWRVCAGGVSYSLCVLKGIVEKLLALVVCKLLRADNALIWSWCSLFVSQSRSDFQWKANHRRRWVAYFGILFPGKDRAGVLMLCYAQHVTCVVLETFIAIPKQPLLACAASLLVRRLERSLALTDARPTSPSNPVQGVQGGWLGQWQGQRVKSGPWGRQVWWCSIHQILAPFLGLNHSHGSDLYIIWLPQVWVVP